MTGIEPVLARPIITDAPRTSGLAARVRAARLARALGGIEDQTLVRTATVQGEGYVAGEKLHESGRLGVIAITEMAHMRGIAKVVSASDPILDDDARFYIDLVKLGSGEILAESIDRLRKL